MVDVLDFCLNKETVTGEWEIFPEKHNLSRLLFLFDIRLYFGLISGMSPGLYIDHVSLKLTWELVQGVNQTHMAGGGR